MAAHASRSVPAARVLAKDAETAGRDPLVTFYRFLPGLQPRRGGHDAAGTLPHRAVQYCEPSRTASAFGYYVFLPFSFQIEWDGGTEGIWSFDGGNEWFPLTETAYPGSFAAWDAIAPEICKGYCPSFLTFSEVPGLLQVWTGWFARTAPGYSLLIKSPANLPSSTGYEVLEGIIETDTWFGPVFTNLRLTRSERPIAFDGMRPFLQAQPIHRDQYSDAHLNRVSVQDAADMPADLWDAYNKSLITPLMLDRERSHYAKEARRRRAGEERATRVTSGERSE
jgi:hypothetical protein